MSSSNKVEYIAIPVSEKAAMSTQYDLIEDTTQKKTNKYDNDVAVVGHAIVVLNTESSDTEASSSKQKEIRKSKLVKITKIVLVLFLFHLFFFDDCHHNHHSHHSHNHEMIESEHMYGPPPEHPVGLDGKPLPPPPPRFPFSVPPPPMGPDGQPLQVPPPHARMVVYPPKGLMSMMASHHNTSTKQLRGSSSSSRSSRSSRSSDRSSRSSRSSDRSSGSNDNSSHRHHHNHWWHKFQMKDHDSMSSKSSKEDSFKSFKDDSSKSSKYDASKTSMSSDSSDSTSADDNSSVIGKVVRLVALKENSVMFDNSKHAFGIESSFDSKDSNSNNIVQSSSGLK